jgi:hypothetical protein
LWTVHVCPVGCMEMFGNNVLNCLIKKAICVCHDCYVDAHEQFFFASNSVSVFTMVLLTFRYILSLFLPRINGLSDYYGHVIKHYWSIIW